MLSKNKLFAIIFSLFVIGSIMIVSNNLLNSPINNNDNASSPYYYDYNESIPLIPPANFSNVEFIAIHLAPCDLNMSSPPNAITQIHAFFFKNGSLKIVKHIDGPDASSYENITYSDFNVTLLKIVFDRFYEILNKSKVLSGDDGSYEYLFPGSILGIFYLGNISDGVKIQSPLFDDEYLPVKFVRIESKVYHYLFLSSESEKNLAPIFKLLRSVVKQALSQ